MMALEWLPPELGDVDRMQAARLAADFREATTRVPG
jgi:hypothetical protein